jgi:hypothetical protein
MKVAKTSGLLIRVPAGAGASLKATASRSFGATGVAFETEFLFATSPPAQPGVGLGLRSELGWEWHLMRSKESVDGANPWELAHAAMATQLGVTADAEAFVEPDLEQEWIYENPVVRGLMAAPGEACVFNDQIAALPGSGGHFAWHLNPDFSQLKAARDSVGSSDGRPVRIAHLDTGYYRDHKVFPQSVRLDLQRNFMDDQDPKDAHDPAARGLLKNPGHGTGTLSILAGNRFSFTGSGYAAFDDFVGGAPEAEIIPVRVGKSVVQILTSSVAAGISYAAELCADDNSRVHAISMSMGGVASQAWADAVNKAYEAGIVYVAAAGNNYSAGLFGVPTRFIVYPARFRRVIAACGVMANLQPYYGLPMGTMQGNWGPDSKMATAMAAFTPNMPWAELGCAGIVDMDGQGTSAATPQIAAAAALYFQKHGQTLFDPSKYPEPWMRVEAIRHALFFGANKSADGGRSKRLGNGILQAARALANPPADKTALQRTPPDSATLPFLHAFTGLGVAQPSSTDQMLALEATQLTQQWDRRDVPNPFDVAIPDPDLPAESISPSQRYEFLEQLLQHPRASAQLRNRIKGILAALTRPVGTGKVSRNKNTKEQLPVSRKPAAVGPPPAAFVPANPPFRRLRGFTLDPSLSTELDTAPISQVTFRVPWEKLEPGPVGEYLEVIDVDPGSDCFYESVHLDDPVLLAQDGLAPSEGTPQFHQQMVYAVASLTIHNFEAALGRRALWRPGPSADSNNPKDDSAFIQRLRVYPHALRERNAYYSPQKIALLFGYFKASDDAPGDHMPDEMVFSCLSHDIVAHETTHALLDGMNRSYLSPTNPDVHSFHEAFADLVALFQHFTFPEILRHQITSTRGDIQSQENLLGQLASQFGRGIGLRGALRDAIGKMEDGKWKPHVPDPQEYDSTTEPHARGAILVAAVFDAFLSIYKRRTDDLLRLSTGGTGVLRPGAIHPDLVNRLAQEAAKSAHHVLTMCVRAIDYCPPVDITFGEFLRAIITADVDLIPDDDLNYRVAFIQAFRKRGIYPRDVRVLSVESLLWRGPNSDEVRPSVNLQHTLARLRSFADSNMYTGSRERAFHFERAFRRNIHAWLRADFANSSQGQMDAAYLGIDPHELFEVRSARIAYRISPDGEMIPQFLVTLLQEKEVPMDANDPNGRKMMFEGGCTVVANLRTSRLQYCIRKNTNSATRLERQQQFAMQAIETRSTYFASLGSFLAEPFAAIHRGM